MRAFLVFAFLIPLFPVAASAQSSASSYTSGVRYDVLRRVVGTISPDPDGSGSLKYAAVRNTYDGAGRLIRVERGELSSWQSEAVAPSSWGAAFAVQQTLDTAYDVLDRKVKETLTGSDGAKSLTQYSYDAVGRLACTAVRMNPAVYGSLPASACTLSAQGAGGPDRITRNLYDDAGQLVQLREGVGTAIEAAEATYGYTPNGRREDVIDGNGNRARLVYDGHDRLSQWLFPAKAGPAAFNDATPTLALASAGSVGASDYEQYGYDLDGNRTSLRKRDGTSLSYSYDALDRMVTKTVPASAGGAAGYSVYYGYDSRGLQTYARFGSASGSGITNIYTGFGELASSTTNMDGTSRTLTSQYDADGNRISLAESITGYLARFTYDGLDRFTAFVDGNNLSVASFGYDAAGRRSSLGFVSNSSSIAYGYDGAGRLTGLIDALSGTSADQAVSFGYNGASQIVSRTAANDAYAWTGAYAVNRDYTANGLNQYSAAGPASFTYDANGNLTSDGSNSYTYDAENRLVSASNGTALSYDPLGRLWRVTKGSAQTRFLYDGDRLLAEYGGSGAALRSHVHGPNADEPLVTYEASAGWAGRFYHADERGSIIAIVDASGNALGLNSYDEYGIPGSTNQGRFQYTGQLWISELGLYYYKARFYSPTLGRFLQIDPVGYDGGTNIYAYVGNDPVNGKDPEGKLPDAIVDLGFILYDAYKIATEGATDTNVSALGADVVAAAVPGVTGAGLAVRAVLKPQRPCGRKRWQLVPTKPKFIT